VERLRRPRDLTARAWWHSLRDAVAAFRANDLTDEAAALTYYSVLAIFPGLIVLVSLLGLLGDSGTVDGFLRIINELGPQSAVDAFEEPVNDVVESSATAGAALLLGLAGGLLSASGYVGAFIRASNDIYGVTEDRPFWKLRPLQIAITLTITLILALVLIALVLTGPLADAIGSELGVGDTALTVFDYAKWPVLLLMVIGVIGLLYRFAPDTSHLGIRWILPGSALATAVWLLASAGFSLYVANFGSYGDTYGSLAGVVVFLIWLWISNIAVILGAQFAYELERTGAAASSADLTDEATVLPESPADAIQPDDLAPGAIRGDAETRE
jgi:membrane protein